LNKERSVSYYEPESILQSNEYRQELAAQRTFMAGVYGWMTIGLLTTALTALVVASSPALLKAIFGSGLFWVLILAELGIAFAFRLALNAMPVALAAILFLVYSVTTGATISIILLIYTRSSVASTFFITAGMFAGISAYGYVTKRSLASIGAFCIMGLWGLLIAMIVNLFLASNAMDWIISIIGVVIFTGLTAYETQKFKQAYAEGGGTGTAMNRKIALLGAFELYLDFINLFLFLLRLLGSRRD
jgi:FtsH-binding integral membrane protein